jgi:hypothetical protein
MGHQRLITRCPALMCRLNAALIRWRLLERASPLLCHYQEEQGLVFCLDSRSRRHGIPRRSRHGDMLGSAEWPTVPTNRRLHCIDMRYAVTTWHSWQAWGPDKPGISARVLFCQFKEHSSQHTRTARPRSHLVNPSTVELDYLKAHEGGLRMLSGLFYAQCVAITCATRARR